MLTFKDIIFLIESLSVCVALALHLMIFLSVFVHTSRCVAGIFKSETVGDYATYSHNYLRF
jgi:hypothetical protein